MPLLLHKKQIQEPSVKSLAPAAPKITRAKMNAAIDALVAAQTNNAEITAKIKALQGDLIDEKPLTEKLMQEVAPFYATELANKDAEFFVESSNFKLKLGKMGIKRIVSNVGYIFDKLKKKAFLEAVTVPLGAVDKYLTPEEQAECTTTEETKRIVTLAGKAEKVKA